jgi:hypothetical protein
VEVRSRLPAAASLVLETGIPKGIATDSASASCIVCRTLCMVAAVVLDLWLVQPRARMTLRYQLACFAFVFKEAPRRSQGLGQEQAVKMLLV